MFKGALFRPDIFDLQHRMCATVPPQLLLLMRVMHLGSRRAANENQRLNLWVNVGLSAGNASGVHTRHR
jgi:hypothetical protein